MCFASSGVPVATPSCYLLQGDGGIGPLPFIQGDGGIGPLPFIQGEGGIGPLPLAVKTGPVLEATTCRRPIEPARTTKTSTTTVDHPFTLPLIFIVFPPVLNLRSNLTKATRVP